MSKLEEILSDLEFYSLPERTELAFRIITSGLIDPDVALKALGLNYSISAPMEAGQWDAEDDNTIYDQLNHVSTEDIRKYVNDVMSELV